MHSSTFFSWVNSGGTDFEFSNGDDKAICDFNFIATPINVNVTHWILVVVCYIHDLCECHRNEPKEISETAKPNRAKVIVLDSLNQRHEEIEMPLRPLLAKLCGLREGCGIDRGKVGKLPFYYPKVSHRYNSHSVANPFLKVFQQPNPCDSGFYPALFLDTFMEQPKWYSEELSVSGFICCHRRPNEHATCDDRVRYPVTQRHVNSSPQEMRKHFGKARLLYWMCTDIITIWLWKTYLQVEEAPPPDQLLGAAMAVA